MEDTQPRGRVFPPTAFGYIIWAVVAKKTRLIYSMVFGLVVVCGIIGSAIWKISYDNSQKYLAPGKNWKSSKKVENYFIDNLRMSPDEASQIRSIGKGNDGKVSLRVSDKVTLDALISNLHYFGFIKDEKAFRYALENTKDNTKSGENYLQVGAGTIDKNATYRISEDMSAWELADVLLNKPEGHFSYDEYGYFFMP